MTSEFVERNRNSSIDKKKLAYQGPCAPKTFVFGHRLKS